MPSTITVLLLNKDLPNYFILNPWTDTRRVQSWFLGMQLFISVLRIIYYVFLWIMYYFCIKRQELTSKLYHREKQIGKDSLRQFCKSLFFHLKETADTSGGKMPFSILGIFTTNQWDECWYHCLQTQNRTLWGCHFLVSRPSREKTRFMVQVRS